MLQRKKWTFTHNNYDVEFDYETEFRRECHRIHRMVVGFETGPICSTRHLQGYCEFKRTVRYSTVCNILPNAYWRPALGSASSNYEYCTKGGDFFVIGTFDDHRTIRSGVPIRSMLSGLLDKQTKLQLMCTESYAKHHTYFGKVVDDLREAKVNYNMFDVWKVKRLYVWQDKLLKKLFVQDDRTVMWVYEEAGGKGKTFLATYLSILYSYLTLDGSIKTRDLANFFPAEAEGICIDVARSAKDTFDYEVLEKLKDGYLVTGKYEGRRVRFLPKKVIVFANFHPDIAKLSEDRWDIHRLGAPAGSFSDIRPIISSGCISQSHPFRPPPSVPNLKEDFSLQVFLRQTGHMSSGRSRTAGTANSASSG